MSIDQPIASKADAWASHYISLFTDLENGGFHERLDCDNSPIDLPKRLVTQCRQLFVYSLACQSNPDKEILASLDKAFNFMTKKYLVKETGGWIFSIDPEGNPVDTKYDLYGHAFVLLACAAYYKVKQEPEILSLAKTTLQFIDQNFRVKNGKGFYEALDKSLNSLNEMRRQNPHMHLFEACIHMVEVSNDPAYKEMAGELLALFFDHFFDAQTGTLGEFFADDLSSHAEEGHRIEPGHHGEWIWLLEKYKNIFDISNNKIDETQNRLFDLILSHGICREYGGIFNELNREGLVIDSNKRIWCGLEVMRAAVIMLKRDAYSEQAQKLLKDLLTFYAGSFIDPGTGLWHEILSKDLSPVTDYRPGTTPYHIYPVLKYLEARTGIEPVYKELQSSA